MIPWPQVLSQTCRWPNHPGTQESQQKLLHLPLQNLPSHHLLLLHFNCAHLLHPHLQIPEELQNTREQPTTTNWDKVVRIEGVSIFTPYKLQGCLQLCYSSYDCRRKRNIVSFVYNMAIWTVEALCTCLVNFISIKLFQYYWQDRVVPTKTKNQLYLYLWWPKWRPCHRHWLTNWLIIVPCRLFSVGVSASPTRWTWSWWPPTSWQPVESPPPSISSAWNTI